MSEKFDVVICGSGSAGLCAATWLARYGIRCKILEKRDGPLKMGQADGVQCRTVEIFESFGIADELLAESCHILEVVFWADEEGTGVVRRTGRTADTQPGLSHQPHVILNQARVNALLIGLMDRLNKQTIDYGYEVKGVSIDSHAAQDPESYPVTVTAEKSGVTETFQAKYVLACDGAHSTVRKALGYSMIGDSTDTVWGVMDMIPRTDFPDIRKKATIRSREGNILIIPREGDTLTRFYIGLPSGTHAKDVKLEDLQAAAKRILKPYQIDFVKTVWWSAYSIGQRLADSFHKDHRIFLAGDACHTHSPKAGQGMNVSLQDGYNIGWKLGLILNGLAHPSILETYVTERSKVASDLIEFDRYYSKLFSSKQGPDGKASAEEFQRGFIKSGKYTAGLTSKYETSIITLDTTPSSQELARNAIVGMRLPSAQVVRFCDSKPLQLMRALKSDGRWRILIFPGDISQPPQLKRLNQLADHLGSSNGPIRLFTPQSADIDSLIEVLVIAHGNRHAAEFEQMSSFFYPVVGEYAVKDLTKIYYDDESYNNGHGHLYENLGINPQQGAIILVRPDQYVSGVLDIQERESIGRFFERFLLIAPGGSPKATF